MARPMADDGQSPFRKRSLEKLSSPERLDQLLRVVDRKSWVPLVALGLLVASLIAWSIVGRVPVNVHGRGILVRPREVVEIQSPGTGYLSELRVEVGAVVGAGTVIGRIARPDLDQELGLQREKLDTLSAQFRTAHPASDADSIERHIRASRELARGMREKGLLAVEEERRRLQEQMDLERELSESLRARLDSRRALHEQRILAREELVDSEVELTESLARLSSLEAGLWDLRTRELRVEEDYLDRLERIADREQQFAEVTREIARLEILLAEECVITSEHGGRILEVSTAVGEYLEPGDRVGSMLLTGGDDPFTSLTYFTVRDGKRLEAGMRIQVTPDPVERQRHGSIEGEIVSVSPFPVTLAEAERVVGNREVADTLVQGGYRIQVVAELERDPSTYSGFRWSSSKGPELQITSGTTTTARVAVEQRAPVTFVLPFLRRTAGVD